MYFDSTVPRTVIVMLCMLIAAIPLSHAEDGNGIDWERAKALYQKSQHGEKLTDDEQAYLNKAKAARGQTGQNNPNRPKPPDPRPSTGLIPLTELNDKYKDQDGGLYGGGKNEPPAEHLAAALKEAAQIKPLDADGNPSANGKIVLLSVGMSNTTMEFSRLKQLADSDEQKSPQLVIVDGAQGGQAAFQWTQGSRTWDTVAQRLAAAGVTAKQVQAVWIKQAEIGPTGTLQEHAGKLKDELATIVNMLKSKFPNIRLTYLSSRIYAGYAMTALNSEPFAYEGAFAVRWLIQDQIKKEPKLNYDPARGEVKAPLLLWGPYLWADGVKPRAVDGLVWERKDLTDRDGTHPSDSGRQKVAEMLLKFFKSDATAKTWFVKK